MKDLRFLKLGVCILVVVCIFVSVISVPTTSYALIESASDGGNSINLISGYSNENELIAQENNFSYDFGDLNADGYINSIDCLLMIRYLLNTITEFPNDVELSCADVNGDEKIDSIDLLFVKSYVLGIINRFPAEDKITTNTDAFQPNKKPEDFIGNLSVSHFNNIEAVELVRAFEKAYPNVSVDLMVAADTNGGAYQNVLSSTLKSNSDVSDVYALEYAFVKRFVNYDSAFENLSSAPYNGEEIKSKLVPYTVDIGRDNEGNIKALSHLASITTFGYKRDIAKEYLGTDDPEKIGEMLSSGENIIKTAKILSEKSDGKVKIFPCMDELFRIYLGAREHAWVENGELVIDPKIEEFVDVAKELRDLDATSGFVAWAPQWSAAICDDVHFAWAIPTWGIPWIIDCNQPYEQKKKGDWGLAQIPTASVWGGTWFAISKNSKNKELAWEFIKFITCNSQQSVDFAKSSGDFVSNVEAIDVLSKDESMINKTINQNPYQVYGPMLNNVNGLIMTKYDDQISSAFLDALRMYLLGDITKDQMWELFKYYVESDLGHKIVVN